MLAKSIAAANLCRTRQTASATHVIARNNVTKQSRSEEPVSEIAAVAEFILSEVEGFPRNDGMRRNPGVVWLTRQFKLNARDYGPTGHHALPAGWQSDDII
jgi:hypothetical protein